jgi:hypothetical protein
MRFVPTVWLALLLAGGPGLALRAQTNLLLNPGLETPFISPTVPNVSGVLATNWTALAVQGAQLDGLQETTNVHGGSSCQEIVVTGLNATNAAMFYEPFTFQPGSVYNGSVWLRAATNSLVQFELRGSNVTHGFLQAAASHVLTMGTSWQQVIINGGWQNGSNGEFTINFLTNGTFWIDDASLSDVTSNYLHAPLMNTTSAAPATLFGMHINMFTATNNWPPLQQGVVRFWDIGIHWNQVETNTNYFVWTKFDDSTNVVWTNNPATQIIYTLGQTPAWAALTTNTPTAKNGPGASSEPRDMNDWSNYVQTVALRYKGLIKYYEVWNETDSQSYYTGAISNMVTMAQIAREVLTNVDPTIKILGPNITLGGLGWLEQFIQAGGPLPDIVTFHDYTESRPESSLGEIVGLRDMLARYPQWSALPIWCTEGAASTNANPQANAGIVSRAWLFWWTQNVQNWCWYTWDKGASAGYVPLSINPPSETPDAGGIAYSNTANWLVGAQMTDLTIDTNGTWIATLQRLGFTTAHVLWNPDVTTNCAIPASWNVFQMRDLSNNVTSLTNVSAVTVNFAPVILDSVPSLAISNAGGTNVTLMWPAPATGFNLYNTTNLAPATWQQITNAVANSNGNDQVTLTLTNTSSFFRLSSP